MHQLVWVLYTGKYTKTIVKQTQLVSVSNKNDVIVKEKNETKVVEMLSVMGTSCGHFLLIRKATGKI